MVYEIDSKQEYFIYRITNTANGKIYIGQTNDPDQRWSQHKSASKHNTGNQLITKAISKYGIDSFTFEIIAQPIIPNQQEADDLEILLIAQEQACDKKIGYNILPGGVK